MWHPLKIPSVMIILPLLLPGFIDTVTGYGTDHGTGHETGEWSPWSPWAPCSVTCGEGHRDRTRSCSIPPSPYNSSPCTGDDRETDDCHLGACSVNDCKDGYTWCHRYSHHCNVAYVNKTCPKTCGECKVEGWSPWSQWAPCSVTCGEGLRERTRSCSIPPSTYNSRPCTGDDSETKECHLSACSVNGGWSSWSSWASCSATCGGGLRTRTRSCDSPPPSAGGRQCQGQGDDTETCNQNACPIQECKDDYPHCDRHLDWCSQNGFIKKMCAKSCGGCKGAGEWSPWSQWAPCSVTCGEGQRYRTRSCSIPPLPYNSRPCTGNDRETETCHQSDCSVNGEWSPWSPWAPCSVTCGEGHRKRTRSCSTPPLPYNSRPCTGDDSETGTCHQRDCSVNGGWSSWSSWASCSATCGGGQRTRTRSCNNPPPSAGGGQCQGKGKDTETCNQNACPIQGGWSSWSSWASCSATCGGGQRRRTRSCNNPPPSAGGGQCQGQGEDTGTCNQNACPIQGVWSSWSSWASCSATCGGGQRRRTRLCNNPPPSGGGGQCQGTGVIIEKCNEKACPCPGSCYIDGVAYPPGSEWQKNCIRYYCEEGVFYSRNVYNKECGVCKCHNDPHFITYDNVKFDWHGQSTYVLSQEGTADCPEAFVNAKFKDCAKGPRGATCVDAFFYKTESSPIIKIIKDDRTLENSQIIINGYSQTLRKTNNGALQILKGPNDKEYPVFGSVHNYKGRSCLHIFGFDDTGFNIKICSYGITIFTHPKLKNSLYGLCGDWNNEANNDLKLRNGAVIQPPSRRGGWFRKVNKNVDQRYGKDWEVKECPIIDFGAVGKQVVIPDKSCDSTVREVNAYVKACKAKVASKSSHLTEDELEDIIEECVFDRCIAYKTGDETLIAEWLDQSGGKVDQKQMEKENTVAEGSCFMNDGIYPAGTEWENECITYRCENGKFYSNKKFNNRCGSCLVNNDPHFTTYDGVRFDWHGHSTYVISQMTSSSCPNVFVNSHFAECAVGHPDATCLHTIYFQPVAGTLIKIVKEHPIQNSKIYVNGHLQELDFESIGELHPLIGANSIKQPAFGWCNNNCLYFTGFNIDGYTIKICSRSLKIYAHPSQQNELYGLCGDWNKEKNGDLKMRNGRIIDAPRGGGFASQQVNQQFGRDWEVDTACPSNADCVINDYMVKENACTANEADIEKYRNTCRQTLTPLRIDLSMQKLNGVIDECTFDQCIAEQSGNGGLKTEWLNQCIEFVKEEEDELKNTITGACGAGYEKVGSQCLYFATRAKHDAPVNWHDAVNLCHEKGGQLAVIDEPTIFVDYFKKNYRRENFWVGLNDLEKEGEFRWVNGEKLKDGFPWGIFTFWVIRRQQPDNHGNEDCVMIGAAFESKFNDEKCHKMLNFVCDDRKVNGK